MRAETAFAMLTEEGRRDAITGIATLADVSEGFAKQVLLGVRTHPCSASVAKTVSGWFNARGIDVAPEEVTGIREPSHDRADHTAV